MEEVTAHDFAEFLTRFTDPKFRSLLEAYAKTISDPIEKQKFDEDFKLLQAAMGVSNSEAAPSIANQTNSEAAPSTANQNIPSSQQVKDTPPEKIRVERGFVVATTRRVLRDYKEESHNLFINIGWSDAIQGASAHMLHACKHKHHHNHSRIDHKQHKRVETTGQKKSDEHYWEIPYVLGGTRTENNVKYYNIAFGSQTYKRAMRDEQFKDLMIRTAIDAIQEQCSEEIDENYQILDTSAVLEAQRRVEAQIRHSSPAQAPLTIPNAEIVPMSRTPIFDLSKEQFLKDTIANATRQHRTLYPHRVPRNWNETVLFSIAWIRTDVGATRLPSCIKCHQTLTNISLSITSSERIDVNGTEWTVVNKKTVHVRLATESNQFIEAVFELPGEVATEGAWASVANIRQEGDSHSNLVLVLPKIQAGLWSMNE